MAEREYTLLLVDDDEVILVTLEQAFTGSDYRIISCNDPFKAYQIIENQHIDVVILDVVMPGMDGFVLLEKIKDFNGMIQVIMLTGEISVSTALKAFRKGAVDIFFKPLESNEQLLAAVAGATARLERINGFLRKIISKRSGANAD